MDRGEAQARRGQGKGLVVAEASAWCRRRGQPCGDGAIVMPWYPYLVLFFFSLCYHFCACLRVIVLLLHS